MPPWCCESDEWVRDARLAENVKTRMCFKDTPKGKVREWVARRNMRTRKIAR